MLNSQSPRRTWLNVALLTAMLGAPASASASALQNCFSDLPDDAFKRGWETLQARNIPSAYWGPSIKAMKPVRVFNDRVNVAVVTAQTPLHESGVYFVLPESSYLPNNVSPERVFVCNDGETLKFRFKREGQRPDDAIQRTPSEPQKR